MTRSQTIFAPALAVVLSLTFICESHATSYASPSDFESVSPNGQYRFVADYPEPVESIENYKPEITYTLYEVGTGVARWSLKGDYKTHVSESWPSFAYGAYVGNSGGVLVCGPEQRVFTALAAPDGKVSPRITLAFKPPPGQKVSPIPMISDNYWSGYSFRSVVEADGESFLLTRVRWGKRILIGFERQEIISNPTSRQIKACEAVESAWAIGVLNGAPDELDQIIQNLYPIQIRRPAPTETGRRRRLLPDQEQKIRLNKRQRDLELATQMAGRFGYRDAIPALRAIEQWRLTIPDHPDFTDEDRRGFDQINYKLWRDARLALRRMGERASGHQPIGYAFPAWLEEIQIGTVDRYAGVALPELIVPSKDAIAGISKGTSVRRVIQLLGAPDAWRRLKNNRNQLEFDIDADKPYSLRVDFKLTDGKQAPARVVKVKRIKKPGWTIGSERDLDPFWRL